MKKELKVEMNQRVKISNKHQVNYPLRGTVIAQTTDPRGNKLSRVRFVTTECWYSDNDLEAVHITKEEKELEQKRQDFKNVKGIRTVQLKCPECATVFLEDLKPTKVTHVPCKNGFCDKAVSVKSNIPYGELS